MKSIIAFGILSLSITAFSATEFYAKDGNQECTIINGKVTKKATFQSGAAGFTSVTTIQTFGTEALVAKAVEVSSGRTISHLGVDFNVIVDGKTTSLYADDSKETRNLIQFINAACF